MIICGTRKLSYISLWQLILQGFVSSMTQALIRVTVGCCCCSIVVLRPRYTSKVMSGRSVNLTTLFLGRLRPPNRLTTDLCIYFRQ